MNARPPHSGQSGRSSAFCFAAARETFGKSIQDRSESQVETFGIYWPFSLAHCSERFQRSRPVNTSATFELSTIDIHSRHASLTPVRFSFGHASRNSCHRSPSVASGAFSGSFNEPLTRGHLGDKSVTGGSDGIVTRGETDLSPG